MIIEILIAIVCGVLAGVVTGLIPGVHVNLISLILISLSSVLLGITSPIVVSVFIIAMSVTHTFLDTIPSTFLGAPDSATALAVLPGHRLLLDGKGYEAVKLTVIGSLLCLILTVFLIPFLIPLVPVIYEFLKTKMAWILIVVVLFMILKDWKMDKVMWNTIIFFLSGALGLIVLNIHNMKQPLFPLLSGLFGVSALLMSLSTNPKIPEQSITETIQVEKGKTARALVGGTFSGIITGFFPGLGAAQAAVIAMQIVGNIGEHAFMIMIGGISTVNFLFSIATLYTLQKARNGAIVAVLELVKQINYQEMMIFLAVALIVGGVATFLALKITKIFARMVSKMNYKIVCCSIIVFILILTVFFDGFLGLIILSISTALGMIAPLKNVKRSNAMGCLLLPVILFFIL